MNIDPFQGSGTSIRDLKQQGNPNFGPHHQTPQQHIPHQGHPNQGFQTGNIPPEYMYQEGMLQQPLLHQQQQQYGYMDDPSQSPPSKTMTKSDWIEVVVVLVMFVLFSSSTIYQFESSFMPHQLLGYDQPPILLVIINGIIFTIIIILLKKFNCF